MPGCLPMLPLFFDGLLIDFYFSFDPQNLPNHYFWGKRRISLRTFPIFASIFIWFRCQHASMFLPKIHPNPSIIQLNLSITDKPPTYKSIRICTQILPKPTKSAQIQSKPLTAIQIFPDPSKYVPVCTRIQRTLPNPTNKLIPVL